MKNYIIVLHSSFFIHIGDLHMTRYVMKQKLFSLGDDFIIRDEDGNDAFFVDGKVFCLGNQLSFQDMEKHELAYIKQKMLTLGQTYEIYRSGELAAVVRKSLFTFFHCTFTVDVPGPDDLAFNDRSTRNKVL